jgi:hypothetical protein
LWCIWPAGTLTNIFRLENFAMRVRSLYMNTLAAYRHSA